MKHENKIQLEDSLSDIISKMSEGNPGAMATLLEISSSTSEIDPSNVMGIFSPVMMLDTFGIYGTDIYVLHNDICDGKVSKTLAVIRAVQLGFFDGEVLKDAASRQDYSGKSMVPVDELYQKVKERLPNFDR